MLIPQPLPAKPRLSLSHTLYSGVPAAVRGGHQLPTVPASHHVLPCLCSYVIIFWRGCVLVFQIFCVLL